jgi:hypothetical protein
MLLMASVFDCTQTRMVSATDRVEDPDLVRDQKHLNTLLGAVLDAIDEVAIEGAPVQGSSASS